MKKMELLPDRDCEAGYGPVFRGVIFATRKKEKIFLKKVLTDRPYLEGPSAIKQGFFFFCPFSFFFFFFFVALWWNCFSNVIELE